MISKIRETRTRMHLCDSRLGECLQRQFAESRKGEKGDENDEDDDDDRADRGWLELIRRETNESPPRFPVKGTKRKLFNDHGPR